MLAALDGGGKTVLFTSGSAVVGTFAGGEASGIVYDEDTVLPLPEAVFAPASANVDPRVVAGFGAAMAARIETEKDVIGASGVRGIVMRPGLVYGGGGSYDIPGLIALARATGAGAHLGSGGTLQGFVHIDELADLYRLAVERAPGATVLHGVAGEVSQRDLASAISRLIGAGGRTASFSLEQMFQSAGSVGISASVNKRLSADKTRMLTGWSPVRADILDDVASGSYAS